MQTQHLPTPALDLKAQLLDLEAERAMAPLYGLDRNTSYWSDLLEELASTRAAYVGAAVTEIASLRAELDGPQVG